MALISFTGSPHGGSHKLLPEWQSQSKITPTTIVDHSIVGSALGAYYYFRDKTGIESHFILGLDGVIWQLMDTGRQADANLNANRFGISIETADNGDPNNFAWTNSQLGSLVWLHNKLAAVHPTIPRKKVTTCSGGGLGYHSLCPTTSSNPWTPSAGKTCPGKPVRVGQWNNILVPKFLSGEPVQEDDMFETADRNNLTEVNTKLDELRRDLSVFGTTGLEQTVEAFAARQRETITLLKQLTDDEANILAAINGIGPGAAQLTDEQAAAFADKVLGALPDKVADELRARIANG